MRHCPQCFKGYETKAAFLSHMVDDWQHQYSKAAAMRAWKAADAKAQAEQRDAAIAALGMVRCFGCQAAIDPAQAARLFNPESEYSKHYYCGACYREIDGIGWVMRAYDSYAYGYVRTADDSINEHAASGYDSMESAERRLRSHMAQMRAHGPDHWLDGCEFIQNREDLRDHLRLVASYMTYEKLGYRSNGPGDPRWEFENNCERSIYQELIAQQAA